MKRRYFLLAILLAAGHFLLAQELESIYDPKKPEALSIWHRVADLAPILRAVESARISPNGEFAVSASKFGYNLMVWQVADGSLLWSTKEAAEIESVVFSPDGKFFATGDENFFVKIRETLTGKLVKALEHDSALDGIAWSHDGKTIASGSEKGDLWFWNATSFSLEGKLNVGSTVNSLDFTLDDQRMVVGGNIQTPDPVSNTTKYDGFVKLIGVKNRKVIREYDGPTGSVKSVKFSMDQKLIASGGLTTLQEYLM